jgi:hypothetical protein
MKKLLAGRRALGVAIVVLGSFAFLATPAFGQSGGPGAATTRNASLVTLSSGLFSLPPNAASVDWMVVNNDSRPQNITVTVYRHGIGTPRVVVAPGPLQFKLDTTEATHNANSVGWGQPFEIGYYYEVIVETDSLNVLPSVQAWPSMLNEVIPGTLIPAGSWVRLR